MTLVCFCSFTVSDKCNDCKESYDCFIKTHSSELCFATALENEEFKCDNASCGDEIPAICLSTRIIKWTRRDKKECFGNPKIDDECVMCERFPSCEQAEIVLLNLVEKTFQMAEASLREQTQEMLDEDHCYGNFAFKEDQCWDCDFNVNCRRLSKIIPGDQCSHYTDDGENEPTMTETFCKAKCHSYLNCFDMMCTRIDEVRAIDAKMYVYKHSVPLHEMRERMIKRHGGSKEKD